MKYATLFVVFAVLILTGCVSNTVKRGNSLTLTNMTTIQQNWQSDYSNDEITGTQRITIHNGPVYIRCTDKRQGYVHLDVYVISEDVVDKGKAFVYFNKTRYEMFTTTGNGHRSIFLKDRGSKSYLLYRIVCVDGDK
jgi:hypothetical protein